MYVLYVVYIYIYIYIYIYVYIYIYIYIYIMNGNTDWSHCALSRVCTPQEKEEEGNDK